MSVVEIKGLRELYDRLDALQNVALSAKVIASAMKVAFAPVLETAKAMVPVREGLLRESMQLRVRKSKDVIRVGIRIGGGARGKQAAAAGAAFGGAELPPARRWHFIEFGTAHQAAHPYLRPAFDANAGRVLELVKTELAAGISKATGRKGAR